MITVKEVEHVAKLARLSLSNEEKELYTQQLGKILDYVSQLEKIDTDGIEPMSHPIKSQNVMREDVVSASPGHAEMLKTAPDKEGPFFKVPKISD